MDRKTKKDIYLNSISSNMLFEIIDFNISISQFEKVKHRFSEICGKNLDEKNLYELYIEFRKIIGHKKLNDVIGNPEILMADELAGKIAEKYNIDVEKETDSDTLKECIALAKFGIKMDFKERNEDSPIRFKLYNVNQDTVKDRTREEIEMVYKKYLQEIIDYYNENVKELKGKFDCQIGDEKDFLNAFLNQDNEHYEKARVIAAGFFSNLSAVYSFDELINEEEKVKSEINIGLTDKLVIVNTSKWSVLGFEEYIQNRAVYAELGKVWDKHDLSNYESIRKYMKYLKQITDSNRTNDEEKEYCSELYKRLEEINKMSLEEVVEQKEEVQESLRDIVFEYQVYIRENMIENIHQVQNTIQEITTEDGQTISFNGELITSKEQAGALLIHSCGIPDLNSETYIKYRDLYKKYMMEKLKEKRGKQEGEIILDDDPELQSIMEHYDGVVRNPFAIHEMQDSFLFETREGKIEEEEYNNIEHICTQIVYGDKLLRTSRGNFGMIFDKKGISPESILLLSEQNIESNKGIYNNNDHREQLYRTSAPLDALKSASEREQNQNTEVDLERATIKPSGVCYFTKLPINRYIKKEFMQVKKVAEEHGLPLVLIDIASLEKEKAQKDRNKNVELDER